MIKALDFSALADVNLRTQTVYYDFISYRFQRAIP